jgi:ferredoxin-NADP reductase
VPEAALAVSPLHSLTLEVGKEAAALYTSPGQYLQVRVGDGTDEGSTKPGFFAIASAPEPNASSVELLVKATGDPKNAADALAAASAGATVEVSPISGTGFAIDKIPASDYHTVLLFATGTGISPIRAAIASGMLNGSGRSAKRRDVRLYYGTRSAAATAFAAEEAQWRAAGVRVIPVYSDEGEDYVQDVFAKELGAELTSTEGEKGPIFSATLGAAAAGVGLAEEGSRTAALLCGHRGMCDAVKALLAAAGVAPEAVLMNF